MTEEIFEQIVKLAPPFARVDPDLLTMWIELAQEFVSQKRFGKSYTKAVALYTLHLMTLDGAMKQENESISTYSYRIASYSMDGEFSQSFDRVCESDSENDLLHTPWGKMYQKLRRMKGGGFALMTGARRRCGR